MFDDSVDVVYRLQGYLNHRGKSAHVGHYTASVAYPTPRMPSDDGESAVEWFEFDDGVVSDMTRSDAAKEHSHGAKICSRDIYMLLYVRDDSASTSCDRLGDANEILLPSESCQKEVEVLNAAFTAEVNAYVRKVSGMEARIQERLEAYKRFFEESYPYPDTSESLFYWVDSEWLRRWVTGDKYDGSVSSLSLLSCDTSDVKASIQQVLKPSTSDERGSEDSDEDDCVIVDPSYADAAISDEKSDGSGYTLNGSDARRVSRACYSDGDAHTNAQTPSAYSCRPIANGAAVMTKTAGTSESHDDDIPFMEPVDVGPLSCVHSHDLDLGARCLEKEPTRLVLRFAPDNAPRLKRISAKFFSYIKENCDVKPFPALEGHAQMRVFEAPSYRCAVCENDFSSKLLKDFDRLREVDEELVLLKAIPGSVTAAVAAGNYYLISRAWLKSYKSHLQMLHKELTRAVSKSKKGKMPTYPKMDDFCTTRRDEDVNSSHRMSGECDKMEMWQRPINKDITCSHGKLRLEKRLYRLVAAETWAHFSTKYPYHAVYAARATDSCLQCQMDDVINKKCLEVECGVRDEIISIAALESLFRRKLERGSVRLSDILDVTGAQGSSGYKVSPWAPQYSKRLPGRMFLVSRSWIAQWRNYIRNVSENLLPKLSSFCLLCMHQKLILSPGLLAAQGGQLVDASSLEVEFVTPGEMRALAERYGNPEMPLYYGLLVATIIPESGEEETHVVWQKCSLASLQLENEQHLSSDGRLEGTVPLGCHDAMDNTIICAECQASSDQRHRDELENFTNRVVDIQQLHDDQAVPTSEDLTIRVNASGRRRSRRVCQGSACAWPIVANSTDTVYMLKAKIYAEIDALPTRQRLYYKGEPLENFRTLKELG